MRLVLILLLAFPAAASAHAQLEDTVPTRGAQLESAPKEVQFRFSESVTAGNGSVRVFDGRGEEVQQGKPKVDGKRLSIGVGALADGGYTATYRVISADSHPVSGGFSFSVGKGGPGAQSVDRLLQGTDKGPVVATALGVARGVQYAAIALGAGTLLLLLFGLGGVAGRLRVAAIAGIVSAVAAVLLEAHQGDVGLFATRFGVAWGLGALAWVAVLFKQRYAVVPLLFLPAVGGHAAVESPVMFAANVVHVAAISGWVGGVAVLATLARKPPDRVMRSFSSYALGAVAVVLATGTIQSIIELSAWSQLTGTGYGRAILIKLGLFAVLIGFGAAHRLRGVRRVTLRGELAVMVVVLGVTGALATYAPGKVSATGPVSRSAVIGPARAEVTVDPAAPGSNELHVYLFDRKTGAQWDRSKELTATATHGALRLPIELRKAGPGHYVAPTATLPKPGSWTVTITARISDFDQYEAKLKVPVR